MEVIRVIDLLNKIANGEEVPKRIKYCGVNYKYDVYDYFNEDEDDEDEPLSSWIDFSKKDLNDEIEIIEDTTKEDIPTSKLYKNNKLQYNLTPKEDKKIKRIQSNGESLYSEYIGEWLIHKERYTEYDELLMNKINEIIDKVNGE